MFCPSGRLKLTVVAISRFQVVKAAECVPWAVSVPRHHVVDNTAVACGPAYSSVRSGWRPPVRSRHVAPEHARSTYPARPCARFAVPNCRRDLVEITTSEFDCRRSDPAVHLLRRAGADDGSAHAGPREGPGNGNA